MILLLAIDFIFVLKDKTSKIQVFLLYIWQKLCCIDEGGEIVHCIDRECCEIAAEVSPPILPLILVCSNLMHFYRSYSNGTSKIQLVYIIWSYLYSEPDRIQTFKTKIQSQTALKLIKIPIIPIEHNISKDMVSG